MEMTRLVRVLRARWRTVAGIGVVCLIAAVTATVYVNENPRSRFVATAPIQFTPQEGQSIEAFETEVEDAFDAARLAVAPLPVDGSQQVILEDDLAQIQFVAEAPSEEEARETAEGLRESYLLRDPRVGGNVDEQLATLEREADRVRTELAQLSADPDPVLAARHAFIDAQIAAVDERLVALPVALATAPDAETRAALESERARLDVTRLQLLEEKAALEPLPGPPNASDELAIAALQARLATITAQYEQVFLRKLGVSGSGVSEPVVVEDLTPAPASPWLTGPVGLLLGLVLGATVLVFVDRARRPVWLSEDLPVPLLAQVPPRRDVHDGHGIWYDQPTRGSRKPAIQLLRSAIEASVSPGAPVAIAGREVDSVLLDDLAEDLGASFAVAGRSVLVIHTDFGGRPVGSSLTPLWSASPDEAEALAAQLLDGLEPMRTGLTVVGAGPAPDSPADALAGRAFREFLELSAQRYDHTVLVVGDAADPAAQVAIQRVGRLVLALVPGLSSVAGVESIVSDTARRQTTVLGAVFLESRDRFVPDETAPGRPIAALPYPQPEVGQRPSAGDDARPRVPVAEPGPPSVVAALDRLRDPDEVLSAIEGAQSQAALEVVANHLVDRTEAMLLEPHEESSPFADVFQQGFVPVAWPGDLPTAGTLLVAELDDADPKVAKAVTQSINRVLGSRQPAARTIDDWLQAHFSDRHLVRTGGEPAIVLLRSGTGAAQILVDLRRLDRERLVAIALQHLGPLLEELDGGEGTSGVSGEVKRFRSDLLDLAGPKPTGGDLWDPDWSQSYANNLRPLAQRGLLGSSETLLTETLSPTG